MKLTIPRNKWMNDPNVLAQIAHVLGGFAIVLTVAYCVRAHRPRALAFAVGVAAIGVIAYAAVKEFWYDPNYEDPPQTTADNVIDFVSYVVGAAIGAAFAVWV